MRIFVSSSFEDLREHRAAAIRILRQLGHEVLAMEDMIAGSEAPLAKVIEMVDRCEAYVGIFAWRYGYTPVRTAESELPSASDDPDTEALADGETSITHLEYLRAVQRKVPVMAFLVDEQYPWPPHYIDGFDTGRVNAPLNSEKIRALRQLLQQERVVSWFTTASDLEARVSAAVTMAGLTRQLDLRPATVLDPNTGVPGDTSAEMGITQAIIAAGDHQPALKIDLATPWWSTRLYLIAALANRLTVARRILIVDSTSTSGTVPADNIEPARHPRAEERFIGQVSTTAIVSTIGSTVPALRKFNQWLMKRAIDYEDVQFEINGILDGWRKAFGDDLGMHTNENSVKIHLNAELLRRWFGDAMLQQPVHILDMQRASVVDLLRLLDYPNAFVPVLTHHDSVNKDQPATERVDVVDKAALHARLARSYLVELLDRDRIV